jgi:hypothetical protein
MTSEVTTTTPALYLCNRLEHLYIEANENSLVFKTATRGAVNFYSAGVVTRDRRMGSCMLVDQTCFFGAFAAQWKSD